MRFARIIVIILFLAAMLVACQAATPSTSIPQGSAIQTEPSGSTPAREATDTLPPTLAQEETTMTPFTPPDEASAELVSLVKEHLAKRLNVSADQIVLSDIKSVVWRDAGLGCPKPGVDYIQVETPGYNILLEAKGQTYTYHTDTSKRFALCMK